MPTPPPPRPSVQMASCLHAARAGSPMIGTSSSFVGGGGGPGNAPRRPAPCRRRCCIPVRSKPLPSPPASRRTQPAGARIARAACLKP
eukprot:354234-Chlamydomonas_euryale.AAC.21